jgi:hypothetical protein
LESFEAATFGCQSASFTAVSTFLHRCATSVAGVATFCRRNCTGSIPAMYASSSIACSAANDDCGAFGARRNDTFR